ncbi:hypothetical protein QWZ04_22375 [Vibrio tapetis subsp. quintayensis]|uniref:hypothetical protein n=1 Tax=Vibrio tapetis TaxID=52443 RepID=UPI0025B564AE|nr:hypothetical protein [Vibrio tapetis]MDN3683056.1 hypothetical protein [Vibrio tapetis subsp. quintayensis]
MKPCFPTVPLASTSESPVCRWIDEFKDKTIVFENEHAVALARLLPLLVCGEQSSQWVFYNEYQRASGQSIRYSVIAFEGIVADEQYHEQALDFVQQQLAAPDDLSKLKRRSQRFYMAFGHQDTLAEHFAQIACLDALVCRIMLAIENGNFGAEHPFTLLCRMIKQDEARHVTLAKQHALTLGFDKSKWRDLRKFVGEKLYGLLDSERCAFEQIGVDLDWVFASKTTLPLQE